MKIWSQKPSKRKGYFLFSTNFQNNLGLAFPLGWAKGRYSEVSECYIIHYFVMEGRRQRPGGDQRGGDPPALVHQMPQCCPAPCSPEVVTHLTASCTWSKQRALKMTNANSKRKEKNAIFMLRNEDLDPGSRKTQVSFGLAWRDLNSSTAFQRLKLLPHLDGCTWSRVWKWQHNPSQVWRSWDF